MNSIESTAGEATGATEDDTFRILSRPGVEQMKLLYVAWRTEHLDSGGNYDTRLNLEFARQNGWNWVEYLTEKNRRAGIS